MNKKEMFLGGVPFKIAGNTIRVLIDKSKDEGYVVLGDENEDYFCNASFIDNGNGLIVSFYKSWLGEIKRVNYKLDQIEFNTKPQS